MSRPVGIVLAGLLILSVALKVAPPSGETVAQEQGAEATVSAMQTEIAELESFTADQSPSGFCYDRPRDWEHSSTDTSDEWLGPETGQGRSVVIAWTNPRNDATSDDLDGAAVGFLRVMDGDAQEAGYPPGNMYYRIEEGTLRENERVAAFVGLLPAGMRDPSKSETLEFASIYVEYRFYHDDATWRLGMVLPFDDEVYDRENQKLRRVVSTMRFNCG